MTKKAMLIIMLILGFVLTMACKTAPTSTSAPLSTEEALKSLYERFYGDLILDGAGTYTVKSGDTLSQIGRSEYQNGFYYPIILLASKDTVVDEDRIRPGMELIIPDLQKNLDNVRSRASIKNFLGEVAKIEDDRQRGSTAQGLRDLAASL